MGIDKINNMKFALASISSGGVKATSPKQGNVDPEQEAKAQELIDQLEERIKNLTDKWVEYLPTEDQSMVQMWKEGAQLLIDKLNTFLETGVWPGGSADDVFDDDWWETLSKLDGNKWHGNVIFANESGKSDIYNKYKAKYENDPTFQDVILAQSNSAIPTLNSAIGFIADKTVEKIVIKTVGKDAEVTIYYKDQGPKKWLVANGSTGNFKMYFGSNCDSDIIIDASGYINLGNGISSPLGSKGNGLVLFGGGGNDIIIGSGSNDIMVGGEGNDRILGMGGMDTINGDQLYNDTSLSPGTGGTDYIDGGEGNDTIWAGGGYDTVVKDPFNDIEDKGEGEDFVDRKIGNPTEVTNKITSAEWTSTIDPNTGEVIYKSTTKNGKVDITAPDGYAMTNAKSDGNDLVITYVKLDPNEANPTAVYLTVRFKDILKSGNQTDITFRTWNPGQAGVSTITDFGDVLSQGNTIHFVGYADDVFNGPKTNLDEYHINASDLDEGSTLTIAELEKLYQDSKDAADNCNYGLSEGFWNPGEISVNGNNEIEINAEGKVELSLNLGVPEGFEVDCSFYKTEGKDLIIYLIDVTNKEQGDFNMIKIRIKGGALDGAINSNVIKSLMANGANITPMGSVEYDAGFGTDLIVGSIGSTTDWGNNDEEEVVKGYYDTEWEDQDDSGDNIDADGDGYLGWKEKAEGTDPNDPDDYPGKEDDPGENP